MYLACCDLRRAFLPSHQRYRLLLEGSLMPSCPLFTTLLTFFLLISPLLASPSHYDFLLCFSPTTSTPRSIGPKCIDLLPDSFMLYSPASSSILAKWSWTRWLFIPIPSIEVTTFLSPSLSLKSWRTLVWYWPNLGGLGFPCLLVWELLSQVF